MDKNNILEEKEAIAQKLNKVGKYFVKGAKISALSAALVMGNVMTTGCSNSSGGGDTPIVIPNTNPNPNPNPDPNPEPEPNPDPTNEVTLDVTRCNIAGRTYGKYIFGKNSALIAGNDEATLAKRGKMNYDEVTTIMNRDIDNFKTTVNGNDAAKTLFNGLQNNLVSFSTAHYVDGAIKDNTTNMTKLLEPIFKKMDNDAMVDKAAACLMALSMRSYLESAGNTTNATQVATDIAEIRTDLTNAGLNYDNMAGIEEAMTYCLTKASSKSGVSLNILQQAVNLAISKDGVWGLRDKEGDPSKIATRTVGTGAELIDERTNNACQKFTPKNIYPSMGMAYFKKLQKFNAFQIQNEISTERLV